MIPQNFIKKTMKATNFKEGDKVYTYDLTGGIVYGTIHKNTGYLHVSEWYIKYEDGEECAVLDINQVYKNKN